MSLVSEDIYLYTSDILYLDPDAKDTYYFFICNCTDKKLQYKRNDSLINITCHNKLEISPYSELHEVGDIKQHGNIFFCYTMKKGGKVTDENYTNLVMCLNKIIETIKDTNYILIGDYSNLFMDTALTISVIKQYIKMFINMRIKIKVHVNTKVGGGDRHKNKYIYKSKKLEPFNDATLSNVIVSELRFFTDVTYNLSDIYNIL